MQIYMYTCVYYIYLNFILGNFHISISKLIHLKKQLQYYKVPGGDELQSSFKALLKSQLFHWQLIPRSDLFHSDIFLFPLFKMYSGKKKCFILFNFIQHNMHQARVEVYEYQKDLTRSWKVRKVRYRIMRRFNGIKSCKKRI